MLDKEKIEALGELHFLDSHENIIVIGPPGVGKSMIATGIGVNVCNAGRSVLFVNAKEFVDKPYAEMLNGKLFETLEKMNRIVLFHLQLSEKRKITILIKGKELK